MQGIDGTGARRQARGLLVALVAALAAAGCGGSDDGDGGGTDAGGSDGGGEQQRVDMPETISEPETDEDLDEDLGDAAETLRTAGCTFGTFEEEEPQHVKDVGDLRFETFPPTSGTHFEDWAPFGLYTEPVDDGNAVHNLEHGGVVVWLGSEVDEATSDAVADLLDDKEKWLVTPREDIAGLYSAAWAKGLSCPPEALATLGPDGTADAVDAWYEAVESTGSEAEKDLPAYPGAMKEPTPERDISEESPF